VEAAVSLYLEEGGRDITAAFPTNSQPIRNQTADPVPPPRQDVYRTEMLVEGTSSKPFSILTA
jgi:hypothetical protein